VDVTYGVGTGKKRRDILKKPGISGSLGGGEVCAILGPSGAGKTSLLNILANRVRNRGKSQRVGGQITLDGKELHGSSLRKRIAYVMQEVRPLQTCIYAHGLHMSSRTHSECEPLLPPAQDLLCATYTPRESLLFSAHLRLPRSMPSSEKAALVEKMLDDLGLLGCADTIVGNEMLRVRQQHLVWVHVLIGGASAPTMPACPTTCC
jgi:ABC-type multidrug transport system ATPase subunit